MKIEIDAKEAIVVIQRVKTETDQLVQSLEKAIELTEKLNELPIGAKINHETN